MPRITEDKIVYVALIGLGEIVLLALYFPISVILTFLRRDDVAGPAWMGENRVRKRRLLVVLFIFALVGGVLTLLYKLGY